MAKTFWDALTIARQHLPIMREVRRNPAGLIITRDSGEYCVWDADCPIAPGVLVGKVDMAGDYIPVSYG